MFRLQHLVDFLEDSLFCEWAYFIDFENRKLETWKPPQMLDEVSFEDLTTVYMDSILKKSAGESSYKEEGDEEEGDEAEGDEESEEGDEQANSGDESK